MPNAKVIVEYSRNDVKVSGGLYGFKPSAVELGEGNAIYEDALTGQTIEARTLNELMKEIAIPEVEAEYDEEGVLIKSEPKDLGDVVDKEILFSAEKVKRMKLSERDGKAIIDKYINDELKYKNYLKLKEAYENDPSKNPMPKAVVQPPVEPKPFIFTNALRERKATARTNDTEAYQVIYDLSGVPDEIRVDYWRTIVKAHANPNYVIESTQSNGDNTVRGFRGKRPVIANNIHVAQDASVHGQLYEFVYDVSDAKYVLCDDAKREELKKLGREDQITYFPNDERAFVPEHGGVFPFAKWMNSRTDLKSDTYREIILKHVNRELEKAGYGDYPVHSFVSRVQKFKDEEQAEAVRKVHTDLPQSINDYKEDFAELAKLNIDPDQKNASIVNKYNINIREKSKHAVELTTELERIQRDIAIMEAARDAEVENLTLKVEKDKLSSKVVELTEQSSLKDKKIVELEQDLEKERTEKDEFVDKNNELYFKNTELEKEKEKLEEEAKTLEEENTALETENTTLTEKVSALEEKNIKLEEELETLDANTTTEINTLRGQVESLNGQLEQKDITHAADKEAALAELRKQLSEAFETEKQEALAKLREELTNQFKVDNEKALEAQKTTLESGFKTEKEKALNELREELNKSFGVKENEYKEVIKGLRTESAENFELANTYSQKMRTFLQENTDLVEENRMLKKQIEDFNNGKENRPKNK
ncbi:hypothetical protein BB542_23830 [Escherichia coli]|uniref:hypothetical protein n=1 Tax=Escherichia coli TaxID=562 RepID=UPI000BB96CCC|nr:hypothetical protein [Escherichia coli]EAN2687272.1 hypothetical protein [Salmonella enterica]ECF9663722.1 hypothetical protein [Salmonella enterica subsp. enterica serovar Uganda]EIX9709513.1 hypothetical protein [Klebsiella pneumoniae]ECT0125326.1 hypothetical protein [Salmonella enterica subsp. enterica serovar Uganda]EGP2767369.1 hypothetical protein [Salmonella enterica]